MKSVVNQVLEIVLKSKMAVAGAFGLVIGASASSATSQPTRPQNAELKNQNFCIDSLVNSAQEALSVSERHRETVL